MIIGVGSVAQTGKDTSAQALARDLGFRRVGFADPLKDLAFEADPIITSNQMTNVGIGRGRLKWLVQGSGGWDAAKTQYPEVRGFLQRLGFGARNVFGVDFWVDQTLAGVSGSERVVIPDVRFLNEFDAIRARGGKLIKVNRPGRVGTGHVSETELAGDDIVWDAVVENNGSILDLEAKVVALVRQWLAEEKAKTLGLDFDVYPVTDNGIFAGERDIRENQPAYLSKAVLDRFPDLGEGDESRVEH